MNIAELLAIPAGMFPGFEILRADGDAGLTYEAVEDEVSRVAGAMRDLGVVQGDRVAILQTNTTPVVLAAFAAATLGAVLVPLNYRAREDELAHMLRVAEPRLLLVGDRYVDLARRAAAETGEPVQLLSLETGTTSDLRHLPTLAAAAESAPMVEVEDEDLALLMFTSGTTAAAKAAMLAHKDLVNYVFSTAEPADGEDRGSVLLVAPLYHVAGLTALLSATFGGRRVVLQRQFEPADWLRAVSAHRITHAFLVPTMLKRLLEHPDLERTDLSSVQVLSYGAAPMPLPVITEAIRRLPRQVQFVNAFGQTETTSTVTMLLPEDHRLEGTPEEIERKVRRLGSIGRPLPDVDVRILDGTGTPVPVGTVGEIAIRSDRTMTGYYGMPAQSPVAEDGWLRTRDVGWMDDDGYVFLTGRASDMIIRGGENIAPDEVEAALLTDPTVEEAAVVGLADETWGERVVAAVVLKPGAVATAEQLIGACGGLASFKRPERVVVIAEPLPRNAMGKLLRKDVRARMTEIMIPAAHVGTDHVGGGG